MDLTVTIHRGATHYWCQVAELPGCFASGRTLSELHEALGEAIGLYLWDETATLDPVELAVGDGTVRVSRTPEQQ